MTFGIAASIFLAADLPAVEGRRCCMQYTFALDFEAPAQF